MRYLKSVSLLLSHLFRSAPTHLSEVDTSVLDLEGDESLAGNVHTLGESLGLSSLSAAQDGGELLLLLGLDLFTRNPSVSQMIPGMCRRCSGTGGLRTVKPAEVAQTLSPAALMMAPLSRWPEPTKLFLRNSSQ